MAQKDDRAQPSGILYCAGRRGSVDQSFYSWVLRGTGIRVEPLGGHRDVVRRLSHGPRTSELPVAGVVDRDAWPDDILASHADAVEVLPFFEVESYLVHPELLGPTLRMRGSTVDTKTLVSFVLEAARATYMPAINAHLSHAPKGKGRGRLEQMAAQYAEQLERADTIIERGNVDALLRYFPGRRLAQRVARKLDFLNAQHLLETILQVPGLREQCRPVQDLRGALLLRFVD